MYLGINPHEDALDGDVLVCCPILKPLIWVQLDNMKEGTKIERKEESISALAVFYC